MIAQSKIDHEREGRELKYLSGRSSNHQRRDLRDYFVDCLIVHFSVQETNTQRPAGCRPIARRMRAPPADACAPGKRKRRKPEPSPLMILPTPCAKNTGGTPVPPNRG